MKTSIIILGLLFLATITYFLYKYSVNKVEWYSSFHYPSESGDYLIQDYETSKYQVAYYDNGWFFHGKKPNHFKWRKLDA
ncbi:MAG: hypothetical protein ACK518_04170 [bacterium]|jgi:hypothetical protein